ncbi:MAG: hypothetical protein R3E13_03040 [Alphaproteobacteria bacterium]
MKNKKFKPCYKTELVAKFYSFFVPSLVISAVTIGVLYGIFKGLCIFDSGLNEDMYSLKLWLTSLGVSDVLYNSLGAFVVSSIFLTLILIRTYPVKLYKDGIHAYNYIELSQGITWDRIYRVDANFFYIQLRDEKDRICVTIPNKWLYNFCELQRLVPQYAGKDHPLAQYFLHADKK